MLFLQHRIKNIKKGKSLPTDFICLKLNFIDHVVQLLLPTPTYTPREVPMLAIRVRSFRDLSTCTYSHTIAKAVKFIIMYLILQVLLLLIVLR